MRLTVRGDETVPDVDASSRGRTDVLREQVVMMEVVWSGNAGRAEKFAMDSVMMFKVEIRKAMYRWWRFGGARTHFKRNFSKMDVKRQGELIALMNRLLI